jgi:hypothetical protein
VSVDPNPRDDRNEPPASDEIPPAPPYSPQTEYPPQTQYPSQPAYGAPAAPSPYYGRPERPGGVTAAAVILFVSSGLGLLGACALVSLSGSSSVSSDLALVGILLAVGAIINVALGVLVLQGRNWARITTIVFCALGIVLQVVQLAQGAGPTGFLGMALNAVVIGLLSTQSASAFFRAS